MLVNGGALLAWGLVFSQWVVLPAHPLDLLWLLILAPLGGLCMLLFNHAVALLSLKYQDVTGLMVLKGGVTEFLCGALLPLDMLPPLVTGVIRLTPFYYTVYYPASLFLGRQSEPPVLAALVLLFWCLAFFAIGQGWFVRARKFYEGVGI